MDNRNATGKLRTRNPRCPNIRDFPLLPGTADTTNQGCWTANIEEEFIFKVAIVQVTLEEPFLPACSLLTFTV